VFVFDREKERWRDISGLTNPRYESFENTSFRGSIDEKVKSFKPCSEETKHGIFPTKKVNTEWNEITCKAV
jgi:hypothetical protein